MFTLEIDGVNLIALEFIDFQMKGKLKKASKVQLIITINKVYDESTMRYDKSQN